MSLGKSVDRSRVHCVRVHCNRVQWLVLLSFFICLPAITQAETIHIEADKMVLHHKSNQAEFSQNVHVTRADFELFSDRLVAYYNDHDLERAEAFGHIRLLQGDVKGRADKAILHQKNNTLTLIGHAVLEQGNNRLEGETIIHDLSLETTQVFPAKGGRTRLIIESNDAGKAILPAGDSGK